ncbi:MAG: septation protein IspZ [Pseudomonadota bacterium]
MDNANTEERRLSGRAKFLVDFGPLLIFLLFYFLGRRFLPAVGGLFGQTWTIAEGRELFISVAAFLPAFAVAFLYSVWQERRVAPMLAVSGVAVGILGTLTLVLQNKTFFYMKPTIVYAMFSLLLAGGAATGRNPLKTLFDGALHMSDEAWRVLTTRYVLFFGALALANEIAWRWLMRECDLGAATSCAGEAAWVNLKVFGFTAINLVFAGFQAPFLMKNASNIAEDTSSTS